MTKKVFILVIWCIFALALVIISVNDFLFFRIEDESVFFLFGLYFLSYVFGISGSNFINGLFAAVAVFIVTFVMNRWNLIGGGDVKLIFPLILFSENNLYALLVGTSVAGMILAIAYVSFGRKISIFRENIIAKLNILKKNKNNSRILSIVLLSLSRIKECAVLLDEHDIDVLKQEIPYGVALACGGFYVIVENLLAR